MEASPIKPFHVHTSGDIEVLDVWLKGRIYNNIVTTSYGKPMLNARGFPMIGLSYDREEPGGIDRRHRGIVVVVGENLYDEVIEMIRDRLLDNEEREGA